MKIIVYHWFKHFIWFDGIFDDLERALIWIKSNGSSERNYQYESVQYNVPESEI